LNPCSGPDALRGEKGTLPRQKEKKKDPALPRGKERNFYLGWGLRDFIY